MELEIYKKSDFYEDYISSQKEYYEREQVDTLLAEKDREIALLKERICNGDVSRLTWIDDCFDKDKEIAELKAKLETVNELIKTARQMLDDAKASHYVESVDAGMRERRLKRALYKACKNWADAEVFSRVKSVNDDNTEANKWAVMRNKCRAMANKWR